MKSPSEQLVEVIIPLLEQEGLFLPEDAKRYKDKLATGTMKAEDWLLAVQKSLDKKELVK